MGLCLGDSGQPEWGTGRDVLWFDISHLVAGAEYDIVPEAFWDVLDENAQVPERFSSAFIVEQAAHRHFILMRDIQARLKGRFTSKELITILNCECGPVWQWDIDMSVAAMVANDLGVDSPDDAPEGSKLRALLEKLWALSPSENAALVDACERVWRGYKNPLV